MSDTDLEEIYDLKLIPRMQTEYNGILDHIKKIFYIVTSVT